MIKISKSLYYKLEYYILYKFHIINGEFLPQKSWIVLFFDI